MPPPPPPFYLLLTSPCLSLPLSFSLSLTLFLSLSPSLSLYLHFTITILFDLPSFPNFLCLHQMFARIDALSTEDIRATANRYINDEDHALAAIGPIGALPQYDWIRERSFHH